MSFFLGTVAALLGLVFGSFFNVCIWRIPRGMSIVWPPSRCVRCHKPIRWYDNIPVLSWLLLRGRCRDCGQRFSGRYALVELLTGLLFLATYLRFGITLATLKAVVFVSFLVVVSFIDMDHQVIPFRLSVPGVVTGLLLGVVTGTELADVLLGAALGAGFVLGAWLLWRYWLAGAFRKFGVRQQEGIGWGDLPFAMMIGAFVGLRSMVIALFAAVVAGVVFGVASRLTGRLRPGQPVSFGPFLGLGGLVGMFFGEQLFELYLRLVLG